MPKAPGKKKSAATKPAPKPAPKPDRLGDDVAPPLSREPVNLILAKTDIAGGKVRIRPLLKGPLRVARGQTILVKHTYRLQEESSEREEYRFLLRSSVGGKEHAPSLARIGDQWGESEDISGYLEHTYTLDKVGRHTLWFSLGGEYTVMAWGDTTVKQMDRQDLEGTLDIVVG